MSGSVGGSTPMQPWSLAPSRAFDATALLSGPGDARPYTPPASWPLQPARLDQAFTTTRAQAGGDQASSTGSNDRALLTWGANAPRYDGAGQSLLLEPATTNFVRNPRLEGLVPGTPGTSPTYTTLGAVPGLSLTTSALIVDGMPVIRCRFFGTALASSACVLAYEWSGGATGLSAGATTVQGIYARLVSGSVDANAVKHWGQIQDSTDAVVQDLQPTITLTSQLQRYTTKQTVPASGTGPYRQGAAALLVYCTSGLSYDFTIDLGGGSLEVGRWATSLTLPAVGSPAASSRGEDVVTAPRSSVFPLNRGTLLIDSSLPVDPSDGGLFPILAALYIDSNNWFGIYFNGATGRVSAGGATGGAGSFDTGATLPTYAVGTNIRVALTFIASSAAGTHLVRAAARVGGTVGTFQVGSLTLPDATLFGLGRYGLGVQCPMRIIRAQTFPQVLNIFSLRALLNA